MAQGCCPVAMAAIVSDIWRPSLGSDFFSVYHAAAEKERFTKCSFLFRRKLLYCYTELPEKEICV